MNETMDYEKIMSDRKLFNKTVYTPLSEALKILDERMKDKILRSKVEKLLDNNIPDVMKNNDKLGFQFRQVATPNHDCQWFIKLTKEHGLKTILCENHEDKFTSNNSFKHSLGQISVHNGVNKKGEYMVEKINIIDLVENDGKSLKNITTLWSEPLVDFHRKLFSLYDFTEGVHFCDMSRWFKDNGANASEYYKKLFLLFVCHGILFENFLTTGTEGEFSKNIVLPALENTIKLTGLKPLIVPIPPMDIEDDNFWISHTQKVRTFIP